MLSMSVRTIFMTLIVTISKAFELLRLVRTENWHATVHTIQYNTIQYNNTLLILKRKFSCLHTHTHIICTVTNSNGAPIIHINAVTRLIELKSHTQ